MTSNVQSGARDPRYAAAITAIGRELGPTAQAASEELWLHSHDELLAKGIRVDRDVAYGEHERHRLDMHFPNAHAAGIRPAVIYVPGGGFIGGDKRKVGTPFHENVSRWATEQGWVGISINYRLAPDHQWPLAARDLDSAVKWIHSNADQFGIDTSRLGLLGHSAGAAHVADYLVGAAGSTAPTASIRAAALISGIYDPEPIASMRPVVSKYYGSKQAEYAKRASLQALATTPVPLLIGVAQEDPADFQSQAVELLNRRFSGCQSLPEFLVVPGENHYTGMYHVGGGGSPLECSLQAFFSKHFSNSGGAGSSGSRTGSLHV